MNYEVIDSHCHLDFPKFNRDRHETIERAKNTGVIKMINSGIDYKTNANSLELARKYEYIHATLGLSPQMVPEASEEKIKQILSQMERNAEKVIGIGEAGLDFFYCKTDAGRKKQQEVFKKVIDIAEKYNKTLVIHGRTAKTWHLK
ncbi:MAG: TatD family hydrolase [Methanolobus sp.]